MKRDVVPLASPPILTLVGRVVRLRCPRCGESPLYSGPFTMHEACAVCGLHYEREPGYFVGAIYVNYGVTVAVVLGTVLVLDWTIGLTLHQQLALGLGLATLVPLVFFRYARSLWLGLNYLLTVADERWERRRLHRS